MAVSIIMIVSYDCFTWNIVLDCFTWNNPWNMMKTQQIDVFWCILSYFIQYWIYLSMFIFVSRETMFCCVSRETYCETWWKNNKQVFLGLFCALLGIFVYIYDCFTWNNVLGCFTWNILWNIVNLEQMKSFWNISVICGS